MLDKLPYLSKSRHLKRSYMHITVKTLQVKYGSEAPSMLRNHNGMMSCSCLDIKLPKLQNKVG